MFKDRRIVILLLFVVAVGILFWTVSRYPALSNKAALSGTDAFDDPLTHQAHFAVPDSAPLYTRVFYTSLNWYETNWRGMAFGLVLAAAFLTLLSYFPKKSSDRRFKNSFMGMLLGTPLGVCVNCVAPIAKSIYEAGSKMELALSVMFSSPTLNIVVLTMMFSIFPLHMALLKLGGTFVLVLLIVPFISKNQPTSKKIIEPEEDSICVLETNLETWPAAFATACSDYWKSFKYILIRTGPLMLLAGFLGALLSHVWSFEKLIGVPVNFYNLAFISLMGTFLPLPIAFDIMLSQALMMSGLSIGLVMTLLFTLGTFSIYSALIIAQTFSLKLAVQLYLIVCVLGMGLGYVANYYSDYKYVQWLARYDSIMNSTVGNSANTPPAPPVAIEKTIPIAPYPTHSPAVQKLLRQDNVVIEYSSHQERNKTGKKPFSKFPAPDLGITYTNTLTPKIFFDPFFFGRGISSGDFNNDGWTDVAVATDNGFKLYQNINGKRFKEIRWPYEEANGKQAINIALIDMNNDDWLDVVITTFQEGNFLFLNPETENNEAKAIPLPENHGLLTNAIAFGDIDRDGFLDMVYGNYHLGVLTRKPIDTSIDQLILNKNLKFQVSDLPGIPGQTQSSLISDINGDGINDLAVGNDYRVADTFYLGELEGELKKVTIHDNLFPVTTENTMSIDTGDINNDLVADIYLANIGFTKGIAVVSNIFGSDMKNSGKEFCASGESVLSLKQCQDMVHLVTLLNPEKQDISERCLSLTDAGAVKDCMVTRLALLAAEKNDESLCDKISRGHQMGQTLCRKYFMGQRIQPDTTDEIPQQALSNLLLLGKSGKIFEEISEQTGVTTAEWSWNAKFADLDNDEWQDLYVVNGVLITQEFATNNFFHNQQGKTFKSAQEEFGLFDRDHSSSYTYIDIDNDGDLDIIGNTQYGPFKIYINNNSNGNSVTFQLKDEQGNRQCIGCKIIIHYGPNGERHQFREIKASGGFHSFDAPIAHFGLGEYDAVSKIEIHWSTGETSTLAHPFPANREYRIRRKMR